MERLDDLADERLTSACAYCGGPWDTKDHVPSRILLDKPHPECLPWVGACRTCNASFSLDEEYVACLIDCILAGTAVPCERHRAAVRRILEKRPTLAQRIENARRLNGGYALFMPELDRVKNVALKLARGHALYELSQPAHEAPAKLAVVPLILMAGDDIRAFEHHPGAGMAGWPEAGSRAMQRIAEGEGPWLTVQPGRYRFMAALDGGIVVRMVLSEYLACEVIWDE